MTAGEPSGEQPPEDDTALLTTALNHYWAWYDARSNRAFQILNYYLVTVAILLTAYSSSINGKHYGIAAALAAAGLGVTALTSAAVFYESISAGLAEPGLVDLQNRIAGRLRIDPIRITTSRAGTIRRRRVGTALAFGLPALLNIGALLYA